MNKKNLGVYLHIPFCNGKCYYCDFVSDLCNEQTKADYFCELSKEIAAFDFSAYNVDTVYFGGGTPSSVNKKYIADILELLSIKAHIDKNAEITIECNPESVTEDKFKCYTSVGVNRLSMGLQTTNDRILKLIGRKHSFNDYVMALDLAKKYFKNISSDLMLGLPEQSKADVIKALKYLIGSDLQHISAYSLKVEEGTPLYESGYKPDDDVCADYYDLVYELLSEFGYHRYEVSNFAFEGYESKHNLKYWQRDDYIGFGVAAHSFVNNTRIANTPDIKKYLLGERKVSECYIEPKGLEAQEETIMLALRTSKGLNLKTFNKMFDTDFLNNKADIINRLKDYVEVKNDYLKLTEKGFYVMNEIIVELL